MRQRGLPRLIKRTVDICSASAGLVIAAPAMGGIAVSIAATMGRPVLFTQDRVGEGEKVFRIYKFRSMRSEQYPDEPDADRITRLGQFLRKTSLDELPQLINILKGDMSLVGPRPLLVRYIPRYSTHQKKRHNVIPGLTGWAQTRGRNTISWEEKFENDVWYVENWTPILDLKILLHTVRTLIKNSDTQAEGHVSMPEFLGSPSPS